MIIDANSLGEQKLLEADVCIIGGGVAGIAIAREFVGSSLNVCVLESGGLQVEADTQALARGENIGRPYFPLESTRLRAFGGTSNHWQGWCRPLDAIDFEKRSWIPFSGWPIDLDDLQPFYDRAQVLCELGPYRYRPTDWTDLPEFDIDRVIAGDKIEPRIVQFSPPTRFGTAYGNELADSRNIQVLLHSNVLTLETIQNGSSIEKVRVSTLAGREFDVRSKSFVLASGGIENARLLLLSNSVQKTGIGNSRDVVGRFFMNHLFIQSGEIIFSNSRYLDDSYTRYYEMDSSGQNKTKLQKYLKLASSVQRQHSISNVSFSLRPSSLTDVIFSNDPQLKWYEKIGHTIGNFDELLRGTFDRIQSKFDRAEKQVIFDVLNIAEQTPNWDSRVSLAEERDQLGQRIVRLDWRLNEIDLHSIERGQEILGAELAKFGIGRLVNAIDGDDGWPSGYIGDWHHMGTTRIDESDQFGVVDANCKVHGIDNLHIAGSSVFPTGGYSNPTLTIVALSLRLADHLRSHLTRKSVLQ